MHVPWFLGELKNDRIFYKSINSCISFLPSINGTHLILVENLVSEKNKLHPVQDAMLKYHGSQCGFCTPGFVMSLFGMYKIIKNLIKKLLKKLYQAIYVDVQDIDQSLMLQKV